MLQNTEKKGEMSKKLVNLFMHNIEKYPNIQSMFSNFSTLKSEHIFDVTTNLGEPVSLLGGNYYWFYRAALYLVVGVINPSAKKFKLQGK